MRKFLLSVFLITGFSLSFQTFAVESIVQKVYKIESYSWNEVDNTYEYF